MSALKSAANSPSSKTSSSGEKSKSSSGSSSKDRDKDRDKDKKTFSSSSSVSSSPKLKTPTIKLKQLDLGNLAASVPIELLNAAAGGGVDLSEGGSDSLSMLFQQGSKNKGKNSLSAVIDKLKSAQHNSTEDLLLLQEAARQEHGVQRSASASSLLGKIVL